ncbi:MAG: YfhO family protein [Acidobacteria bacterium]|nr:YfhO family protein [Acidobacteriota bacterium]
MNPTFIYVGVIYAIAVALARRGGNPLPKRIAVLFYALVLVFFFKAMTGPYVCIATDIPKLIAPWSASAPGMTKYTVMNGETQDVVMQLVPWAHQVRNAWLSGHAPLWNALAGCGYPLLANAQSAAFSPLRILALPLPLGYAMTSEAAMKMLVALTFTFLYCRRRYGVLPASVAALAYGFGPFVVAWLHFAQSTAACFLPAVIYQIDLLVERRTYARFAMTAVIGATVVFCGHPETAVHILFFAIAYVLWIVIVEKQRAFLPALAGAGAVAFLLALPMIIPFAENVRQSTRFEDMKKADAAMPFSDATSLALLVQPRLYGTRPGNPWGPAGAEAVTGFAGILGIASIIAIAIDAIARRRFRDREVFFVIAAIAIFVLLANVKPAVAAMHAVIGLAANARLRFLFAWILAVLIAAALNRLRTIPFAIGLASAALLVVIIVMRTPFPSAVVRHDGIVSIIPSAIVLLIAAVALVPRMRTGASLVLVAAVIAEMWPLTIGWNSAFPIDTFYPRTLLIDAVLRYHRPGFDRVAGIGGVLFPNTNAMFGIEDARIHDPMEPAAYVHFIGDSISHDYYKKWNDATPMLDRLNVRWLMTEPNREIADSARYVLRYAGPDGRLYENLHVKPRFFADGARVVITRARGDEYTIEVDAPQPARILSSVGYSRAWNVESRPRPVVILSGSEGSQDARNRPGPIGKPRILRSFAIAQDDNPAPFLAFAVPAGHARVRVRYVDVPFRFASIIALLTAAALVCFMIRARVQRHLDLHRRALRDRDRMRPAVDPGGP